MVLPVRVAVRVKGDARDQFDSFVEVTAQDGRGWRVYSRDWLRDGTSYDALHVGRGVYYDPDAKQLSIYQPTDPAALALTAHLKPRGGLPD